MKKRIKLLFVTMALALGFFFTIGMVSLKAHAEELPNTDETATTEPTEQVNIVGVYEYNEDGKGNAKFTLYSDYTFVAELHDLEKDETITGNGTYILDGNILILNTDNGVLKCKVNGNKLEPYEEDDDVEIETPNADAAITPATTFLERFKFFKWSDFEAVIGWVITYLAVNYATILAFVVTLVIKKTASVKQSKKFQDALAKLTLEQQEEIKSLVTNYENKLEELQNNLNDFIKTNQEVVKSYQEKLEELQADSTVAITTDLKQIAESLK